MAEGAYAVQGRVFYRFTALHKICATRAARVRGVIHDHDSNIVLGHTAPRE